MMINQTPMTPLPIKQHRRINSDLPLKTLQSKRLHLERQPFDGKVEGFPIQIVDKYLTSTTINEKYRIIEFLDKGSYGQVLSVVDLDNPRSEELVVKVMTNYGEFLEEVKAMQRIFRYSAKTQPQWRQGKCPVPRVVSSGFLFQLKLKDDEKRAFSFEKYQELTQLAKLTVSDLKKIGKINPYIIMPRYQVNLADYFVKQNYDFSIATILDLGCRVIEQLKIVHRAGYIYNDLKPDNIMLERKPFANDANQQRSAFENIGMYLIDFGFCTKYKDRDTGVLFHCESLKKFRGNLRYSSADQLDFFSTGRKDDMIALCYILVYMLNKGKFLDTDDAPNYKTMDSLSKMKWAKNKKRAMTPQTLCRGRAAIIFPFVEKVFGMGFYDKPNYDELVQLLEPQRVAPGRRQKYFAAQSQGFRVRTAPISPLMLSLQSSPQVSTQISPQMTRQTSPQMSSQISPQMPISMPTSISPHQTTPHPMSPHLSLHSSPHLSPERSPQMSPTMSIATRKPPLNRITKHESYMNLRTIDQYGLPEYEGQNRHEVPKFSNALSPINKFSQSKSKISINSPASTKGTKPMRQSMMMKTTKKVQIKLPIIITDAQRATIAVNSPQTQPIKPRGHRSTFSLDGGMQFLGSIFS